MTTDAEAIQAYKTDKLMCDNVGCPLRLSCQRHQDFLKAPVSQKVESSVTFSPDFPDDDTECSMWVIRDALRTENLRNNPKLHKQFAPGTRHVRRKGGAWD